MPESDKSLTRKTPSLECNKSVRRRCVSIGKRSVVRPKRVSSNCVHWRRSARTSMVFSRRTIRRERGRRLETVLNRLFAATGILVRENFMRIEQQGQGIVEQVDGIVEFDGHIYLVEMKWLKNPVGTGDVAHHLVRVINRGESRGIFISYSEYTPPAIQTCKESLDKAVVILCTLQELVLLLEREGNLEEFLREKIHGAIIDKQPLTKVL